MPPRGLGITRRAVRTVGRQTMAAARDAGGIVVLAGDTARALFPPTLDGRELVRSLYKMGYRSVPIVVMTALFVGALMVIQLAAFVKQFNANALVGWGTGYSVLREVGPILIGLMFSGRVGANNAAELGTMTVTDQIDGLQALAIDPIRYLVVPRVIAMIDHAGRDDDDRRRGRDPRLDADVEGVLDIDPLTVWYSLVDNLGVADFLHGIAKARGVRRRDRAVVLLLRPDREGRRGRRRPRGQLRGGVVRRLDLLPRLPDDLPAGLEHVRVDRSRRSGVASSRPSGARLGPSGLVAAPLRGGITRLGADARRRARGDRARPRRRGDPRWRGVRLLARPPAQGRDRAPDVPGRQSIALVRARDARLRRDGDGLSDLPARPRRSSTRATRSARSGRACWCSTSGRA